MTHRGEWYQIELTGLDIPVWIYQSLATVEGSLANVPQVSAEELAKLPISGATGSRPIAIIQPEVMNVRLGPGIDYEVLTTLPQGTQVEIVGIDPSGEWLQVELDGLTSLGWLYRDLVQVDCPLVNVRRITETEISQQPAGLTQPYALFAYSGPGLAYDIVATIPRGTWAEIIAIGDCPPNVWYQIIVPGLDEPVWVIRDFVKVAVGSLAGIPIYGVTDFVPPSEDDRPIAVTQPITLNVRSGPGLQYDVVAEVPQGTQARIYGIDPSGDWILVELEGHSSLVWIYCHMTQVQGSVVGVRRVTARRDCGAAGRTCPAGSGLCQVGSGHGVRRRHHPAEGDMGHDHLPRPAVRMASDPRDRNGRTGLGSPQSGEDNRLARSRPPSRAVEQPQSSPPVLIKSAYQKPPLSITTAGAFCIAWNWICGMTSRGRLLGAPGEGLYVLTIPFRISLAERY